MRSFIAGVLVVALTAVQLPGAVRGDRAAYVGGTASLKQGTQGKLDVSGPAELVFAAEKSTVRIPYQSVTSLEFGQKIGRRVGATVALGITTLGIGALPVLFSKKKRHYLTIGYTENGTGQAAVFELAKDTVRSTLATLEARTGKQVERDDTADQDKPNETAVRTRTEAAPAAPNAQQPSAVKTVPAAAGPGLTNIDVAKMVQAGIAQDVILTTIKGCTPQFSMLPADLDALMKAGVSETIIKAMAARTHGR